MRSLVTVLVISIAAFAQNPPTDSGPDPAFAAIPFDLWLAERDQAHFQWSARVSGGELDSSQRLRARVDIQVDGHELVKRRGRGELAFFVQFSDRDHHVFQSHRAIQLQKVTEAGAKSDFVYTQLALVVPGDYRVDLAILDTNTGEHATFQRALRVAPRKSDPLPDSWRDLPPVEFTEAGDPPEGWFQPHLNGRLHLPLETRRPVRIEVLLNASPSATGPGFRTGRVNNQSLGDLLPALKVISQVKVSNGTLNVSLLDITRRQVLFTQDHVDPGGQELAWARLQPALGQANPNQIDVRDLADQVRNSQFFVEEVRRRMVGEAAPGADSSARPSAGIALVVLSGPMEFASGDDLHPIQLAQRPPGRVFYIRYHAAPRSAPTAGQIPIRPNSKRSRGLPEPPPELVLQEPLDRLGPLLKPLQPRVFDVYNSEQFRRALADLMKEIAQM